MGKFESKPEIRGDTPKISSNELDYFYRINTLKMKYYKDNMENIDNLKNSLENAFGIAHKMIISKKMN